MWIICDVWEDDCIWYCYILWLFIVAMLLLMIYESYEIYVKYMWRFEWWFHWYCYILWLFIAAMLLFIIEIKLHVSV